MVRMFVLIKSQMCVKMGQVRWKTRLVGQILENLVYALTAVFQSDYGETWSECLSWFDEFENRLCLVKN